MVRLTNCELEIFGADEFETEDFFFIYLSIPYLMGMLLSKKKFT